MSEIDIRPVAEHERRATIDTLRVALLTGPVDDETFELGTASIADSDGLAAWDGDRCVGHAAAFRFDSTVPGGARLPTAGVTRVGVLPTHTRRGLLTQLVDRLLQESRERGNTLATLHASETPIYRRFGFGLATDAVDAIVTPRAARPWRRPALPGTMRILRCDEVLDVVPDLYARVARWRIGSISRPEWMWKRQLADATRPVAKYAKGTFVAIHSDGDGVDDGYVYYEVDWDESFASNPVGSGKVLELWGASPSVEIELWRYVLDIDLVTEWRAEMRPVDEPIRRTMHDSRAYEVRQRIDDQWIRILDVDAALTARSYGATDEPVTIAVTDPMFDENTGAWRITGDGAERTTAVADIDVDVTALATAYLGAVSWHDLATSGQIDPATDAGLLTRLDELFASRPTPFCGTGY